MSRRAARDGAGISHHSMGGDDWRQDHEDDLRLYANALINAAARHLSGTNRRLVVAADERLNGMIRENSEYPHLVGEGVTLNPDDLDRDRLRDEAAACLERAVEARRAEAWDKVAMSLGRGDREASDDPADIVTAAAAGRVAHLFARTGARLPGRFDDRSLAAEPDEDGPDDLVDRAIVETLRNGGDIFPLGDRARRGHAAGRSLSLSGVVDPDRYSPSGGATGPQAARSRRGQRLGDARGRPSPAPTRSSVPTMLAHLVVQEAAGVQAKARSRRRRARSRWRPAS